MDQGLSQFVRQWAAVVVMSVAPVVFCAFVSIPLALGHHPGDVANPTSRLPGAERHFT